jgi:hypothetical protein
MIIHVVLCCVVLCCVVLCCVVLCCVVLCCVVLSKIGTLSRDYMNISYPIAMVIKHSAGAILTVFARNNNKSFCVVAKALL